MTLPDWSRIKTGETFEALVTALISFKDPKARLFGKRGPDGGQDVRSGDGRTVFQAKFHMGASAALALGDARNEAEKIQDYRSPGHKNEPLWQGVTHWKLVTNAEFGPQDHQRWKAEIVPLFNSIDLVAEFWGRANLDSLLFEFPPVCSAFFEDKPRVFLSMPEARVLFSAREVFLPRATETDFVGRQEVLAEIRQFLAAEGLRFLVVAGPGGVGKTRLAIEAGSDIAFEGDRVVYWANVETMAKSNSWFEGIIPERPTLLIVDEPEDESILKILVEQFGGGLLRGSNWKILVVARSQKDPVVRHLFSPRRSRITRQFEVAPLPAGDMEQIAYRLLADGPLCSLPETSRREIAGELGQRFDGFPIWLTLAVRELERTGNLAKLPTEAGSMLEEYLREAYEHLDADFLGIASNLLNWLALLGTVNSQDEGILRLLAENCHCPGSDQIKRGIRTLVGRMLLRERGVKNRLVEVKPDVLRDHLLRRWLTVDLGPEKPLQASEQAKTLEKELLEVLLKGNLASAGRSILHSLVRTEMFLRLSDQPIPLLASFFEGIRGGIPRMPASLRIFLIEVLTEIASAKPAEILEISKLLRTQPVESEQVDGLFEPRQITWEDVLLQLPWLVCHAATGATERVTQKAIVDELCRLIEFEAQFSGSAMGLPKDGQRATSMLLKVYEGGRRFWSDYSEVVHEKASDLLAEMEGGELQPERLPVVEALLSPILSFERQQTEFQDHTVTFHRFTITNHHPAWKIREELTKRVKGILRSGKQAMPLRITLWEILVESHRSANQVLLQSGDQKSIFREILLNDFRWVKEVIDSRPFEMEELVAARNLWDWHLLYEKDTELKALSNDIEGLYLKNDIAGEFEPLFGEEGIEDRLPLLSERARLISQCNSIGEISEFIDRAMNYLRNTRKDYQLLRIAYLVGKHANESPVVLDFCRKWLAAPADSPQVDFAVCATAGWILFLRTGSTGEIPHYLKDLLNRCSDSHRRVRLLLELYSKGNTKDLMGMTGEEHRLLRAQAPLFVETQTCSDFLRCVGWSFGFEWIQLRDLIENVLEGMAPNTLTQGIDALIDSMFWGVDSVDKTRRPPELAVWLLNQAMRLSDLEALKGHREWEFKTTVSRLGYAPLPWLPNALKKRAEREVAEGPENFNAVGFRFPFGELVKKITPEQEMDRETIQAVRDLLDLIVDRGRVGFRLPEIFREIDPHGFIVPKLAAERFEKAVDQDQQWRYARIAGQYGVASPAWRTIAKPVLKLVNAVGGEVLKRALLPALTDSGPRAFSFRHGEVAEIFSSAVEEAKNRLETETDPDFQSFWKLQLKTAEAELWFREEEAKENRGE